MKRNSIQYRNYRELDWINGNLRNDARGFIDSCEQEYYAKLDIAARKIAENINQTGIILLAGPSSSGKTTSAYRLCARLAALGIQTRTISMDDYFMTLDRHDPKIDFEAPERLDIGLLRQHMQILASGGEIQLPHYDFHTGIQSLSEKRVRCEKGAAVIFEGLHALSDLFDDAGPAIRIYISPRMRVTRDGEVFLTPEALRFLRRSVRDVRFRSADFARTLSLWPNVIRGERRYVLPSKVNADILIDTSMPYEPGILAAAAGHALAELDPQALAAVGLAGIAQKAQAFEKLNPAWVPADSLMREFIGNEGLSH